MYQKGKEEDNNRAGDAEIKREGREGTRRKQGEEERTRETMEIKFEGRKDGKT